MKVLYPKMYKESIFSIDYLYLKNLGIRGIIFDIDNTLVPHNFPNPNENLIDLFNKIEGYQMKACIVSNNSKKRVEEFCKGLNVPYIYGAKKPFKKAYKRAMEIMGTDFGSTAVVGDQIFSDILGGNLLNLYTILVKPVKEGKEGLFILLKRRFEKKIITKIQNGGV